MFEGAKLCQSTTDTLCYWKNAPKRKKDPRPLHMIDTGKKCRRNDRYINIDPRPVEMQTTTKEEVDNFLAQVNACKCLLDPCTCTSNWVAMKVINNSLSLSNSRFAPKLISSMATAKNPERFRCFLAENQL